MARWATSLPIAAAASLFDPLEVPALSPSSDEAEATVIGDQVLKIDHFLNHRIEPRFITEMGGELARRLAQFEPSVVLTAEASGIAALKEFSVKLRAAHA